MNNAWVIKGGRLVDPVAGRNEIADLYIDNGTICDTPPSSKEARIVEAEGLVVAPGFIDLHVHFREPGNERAETIKSGSKAAARGGFTTVVTMPNTTPPIDSPNRVRHVLELASDAGSVRVLPTACLSTNRAGMEPTDIEALAQSGAVAFTDDGTTVMDDVLMESQLRRSAKLSMPVMDHAIDLEQAGNGVIREGYLADSEKLPSIPASAEAGIVTRDIRLAEQTGCHIHIQHVSCKESVSMIHEAVNNGLPVTAEVTPHHLALALHDIDIRDADFKMNPPLGTEEDRSALLEAIVSGTITCFATDHAPHLSSEKANGFLSAPFGVVGLETAVGVTYTTAVLSKRISLLEWVRRWTEGPAKVLGITAPTLSPGVPADIALLDLESRWDVSQSLFLSKSANTPFKGASLTGRSVMTLMSGITTWLDSKDQRVAGLGPS